MGGIQPWHIIVVVVVALLLFGGRKLPDAARGLGRSLRILKAEVGAMNDDKKDKDKDSADLATAGPVVTTPVTIAPAPLPVNVVEPIPPVQPVSPAQITINGRPIDQAKQQQS